MSYKPPFSISNLVLELSQEIHRKLGVLEGSKLYFSPIKLRKSNTIKTIQSSLAIEGNTLNIDQITHILKGKRILGPEKDILEVKNAIDVYENLLRWNCLSERDFLNAHKLLLRELVPENGAWRAGNVGIMKEEKVAHLAPPPDRVPYLMKDLFKFLTEDKTNWLLKSCIFHYEVEFIHPFSDGNGRMGRLWQQLILMKVDPIFQFLPVEVQIKSHQQAYYKALGESDQRGESTAFIEFSLKQILNTLDEYTTEKGLKKPRDFESRIEYAKEFISKEWFSRKDYLEIHNDLSTATASRDLANGVDKKLLSKTGKANQMLYKFKF